MGAVPLAGSEGKRERESRRTDLQMQRRAGPKFFCSMTFCTVLAAGGTWRAQGGATWKD